MKTIVVGCVLMVGIAMTGQEQDSLVPAGSANDTTALTVSTAPKSGLADDLYVEFDKKDSTVLQDLEAAARVDSLWLEELGKASALYSEMYGQVQRAAADSSWDAQSRLDTETLKKRLARLDERTPFNITYNTSLERVIKSFLLGKRDLMERMLTASQFYFPMFEEALDKYDLPLEIKYLAIVESALNPRAKSRVGATGLWQFMFSTGRMYGLDVSSYVDERSDPVAATEAACQYLAKLYEIFGDWDLALAAYNSGPGNVNKAIRRSGGYRNYWNLRPYLPRETAGYVPAFFATMYLFEYAAEHGLQPTPAPRPYFETDTIRVRETLTFEQISSFTGVSTAELRVLNPSYKLEIIPRVEGKDYTLRLPVRAVGAFVANEDTLYNYARHQLAQREKPLPRMVTSEDRIRYRVRSGDYLGKIAERYGVRVSQIKRWNGLRSNNLRIGQRLTIYPRKPVTASVQPTPAKATQDTGSPKVHVVRKGDSLWTISRRYPGVTIEDLRQWNGIRGNNLQPGTRLKLCNCPS